MITATDYGLFTRYDRDGVVVDVRTNGYTRYDETPCTCIDLRGHPCDFFSAETVILGTQPIDAEWTRYWYVSDYEADALRRVVELMEQRPERYPEVAAFRGGNRG